jgi:cation transport regulator ChaB
VLECRGQLPQDIQHTIFEAAVLAGHDDERYEALREQLAVSCMTNILAP